MVILEKSSTEASASSSVGAIITMAYVGREVKTFGVLEPELQTLAFFNTLSTILFSLTSSFVSIAIGIWVTAAFTEKPTPAGELLVRVGAPVLCALALVALVLGLWALWSRHSTVKAIRERSKQ